MITINVINIYAPNYKSASYAVSFFPLSGYYYLCKKNYISKIDSQRDGSQEGH